VGSEVSRDVRRELANESFESTWRLVERPSRSADEDASMIHAAHASCLLWEQVGDTVRVCRAEWLCSRAYAVLGRAGAATYHAERTLELCERHGPGDVDLAYAYEALARAHRLSGRVDEASEALRMARTIGSRIADAGEREMFESDLADLL